MVRAKNTAYEGPKSGAGHVVDGTKVVCDFCGGTRFIISTTIDDPNDIAGDTTFTAYDITIAGGVFFGVVAMCLGCGHEKVPFWYCCDVTTSNAGTLTMTNLDAGTADTLAGLYVYPLAGTDIGKYTTIASHTAASPTVITTDVALNNDCDGYLVVTNLLPVGLTAAS